MITMLCFKATHEKLQRSELYIHSLLMQLDESMIQPTQTRGEVEVLATSN